MKPYRFRHRPYCKAVLARQLFISRTTLYSVVRLKQIAWVNGRAIYTPRPIGRPRKERTS